jgi:dolichyl-phosphate-mannose--protein O-mannosyl transferase
MMQSAQTERRGGGRILGFPLEGFGLFTSLLLSFAAAFFTFFASTTIAIFALLGWKLFGGHAIDFAVSYRYVGFPAGVVVLIAALPVFGTLWVRAKLRK